MRKKLKYIGFYDAQEYSNENRAISLAGRNKMDYVISSIVNSGYDVEILSPTWTANNKGFIKGRTTQINEHVSLKLCPTFGAKSKIGKILRIFFALAWLFWYLIFNVKKNEIIFSYHSLQSDFPIYFAKKIKRFKLFLEVNERYNSVHIDKRFSWIEDKIIESADIYLFSNNIISNIINNEGKPYIVNHGIYVCDNFRKEAYDDKIHVVYAGIIDTIKSGAFKALESAKYLNDNYVLHIIGTGTKIDVDKLKNEIEEINKKSSCIAIFDGLKNGNEYKEYLRKMDIGLSTQTSEGEYLKYSFPSKILSYLSLGLRVVTSKIECIVNSDISDLMYYYDEDTPKSIANAIMQIDLSNEYNCSYRLNDLDRKFVSELRDILKVAFK